MQGEQQRHGGRRDQRERQLADRRSGRRDVDQLESGEGTEGQGHDQIGHAECVEPPPGAAARALHEPACDLHAEHLLRSAIQAIDLAADDREPARWHFRIDGADYLAESDGDQWSVTAQAPAAPADVTITATTQSLTGLVFAGSDLGIDIKGEPGAVQRFRQLISTVAAVVEPV